MLHGRRHFLPSSHIKFVAGTSCTVAGLKGFDLAKPYQSKQLDYSYEDAHFGFREASHISRVVCWFTYIKLDYIQLLSQLFLSSCNIFIILK